MMKRRSHVDLSEDDQRFSKRSVHSPRLGRRNFSSKGFQRKQEVDDFTNFEDFEPLSKEEQKRFTFKPDDTID